MKEQNCTKKLFFVDTDSIPYACRKLTENQVIGKYSFVNGVMYAKWYMYLFASKSTWSRHWHLLFVLQVFISGMKLLLNAGVYPGEATDKILAQVQPLFTLKLQKNANVIEAGWNWCILFPIFQYKQNPVEGDRAHWTCLKEIHSDKNFGLKL